MTDVHGSFSQEAKIPTATGPLTVAQPDVCEHCKSTGFLGNRYGQDVECVGGILIDIDEYHEGYQRDLCYPVAPCHPDWKRQCADENWCPDINDVQARLEQADAASLPVSPSRDEAEGRVNP